MNRPIEFRVYDGYKMHYGNVIEWTNGVICFHSDLQSLLEGCRITESAGHGLMQWTGLFDKNVVKIFECDILKNDYGLYQVCFGEYYGDCQQHHEFGWYMKKNGSVMGMNNCETNYDQMEVIGNIFENPELLEEK